jgi:hypothetical protein
MGREAACQCNWAGKSAKVKVLLESSELVFRGEIRRHVPFSDVKDVKAQSGRLSFTVAGETVELFLGTDQAAVAIPELPCPEATALKSTRSSGSGDLGQNQKGHTNSGIAEKWAKALTAGPPSLARKPGITSESVVWTLGSVSDESLQSALAEAAHISDKKPALVVACVNTPKDLESALAKAHSHLADGIPIWLVFPKGQGHPLNESIIRSALLPRGLVDTKVASVSAALTAIRFNRRRVESS